MRALFNSPRACFCLAGLVGAILAWSGCASHDSASNSTTAASKDSPSDGGENHLFDPLMKGDRVEIELRGTPSQIQPSVQELTQDGTISLENIGSIPAAGLTPAQLEEEITTNYVPAIYKHVNVHVTPLLRYFYVGGQVNNHSGGGRQTYSSSLTVTRAIQAAGDFTDYADQRHVRLTRIRDGTSVILDCKKILRHQAPDPEVAPGDQIYVPMRRF
jgi:protein involved in polysaccharide export with SLBB domain